MAEPFNPDKYLQNFDPDKYLAARSPSAGGAPSDPSQTGDIPPEMWKQFGLGALQGIAGVPEAAYQWGERLFGLPRYTGPGADTLRSLRDKADATWPGVVGEVAGGVIPFLAGGEALGAAGITEKVGSMLPEWLTPAARTALTTGAQSTVAQPSRAQNLPDFLSEKGEQFGIGAILGRLLGRPIQQAQHDVTQRAADEVTAANTATEEANQANAKAVAEANKVMPRAARRADAVARKAVADQNKAAQAAVDAQNKAARQAVDEQNRAALETHRQTVATEKEQHQALTEAERTHRAGERQKAQAVATELGRRRADILQQRQAQLTAKSQMPQQATAGWWQRTGERIGENLPADARPETGARIQNRVGARLNEITNRMTLDPADASFTDQISEIRRQTSAQLQEHNQARFFSQPQRSPLQRLIHGQAEGEMLPRTQEAPQPPASGMWADHVLDPLKKGPLSGRQLTEYISRLGNEANTLATRARAVAPGSPEYADLLAQANALRQVQDTVIGHAAGSPEDKLALEQARQAYLMWGVGNDAAKASRGGVATPTQLIDRMVKRLGEARYKQALIDPKSPYHDDVTWLQQQQQAHGERIPSVGEATAGLPQAPPIPTVRPDIPIPAPSARTPPRDIPYAPDIPSPTPQPRPARRYYKPAVPTPQATRPVPDVVSAPKRAGRDYLRAGEHFGVAALLRHDPWLAGYQLARGVSALRKRGQIPEGSLEAVVRQALTNRPRLQRAARGAAAGTAAQVPKNTSNEVKNLPSMFYRWGSGQ